MKRKIRDIEECGVSINNAFDNFITSKKSEGRRDATIRSYKGSIKDFMKFCEDKGYTDVSEINKDLVEKYKLHLLDKDISAETRNTYLRTLKAFTSYLFEEENLIPFKIKLFQAPVKEEVSVYSDEEIKKLLNCRYKTSKSFSEVRDYYLMLTFLLTGVRRGTLVNMLIEDVRFDEDVLILRHIKRNNVFKIQQIPLNPDLKVALRKYLKRTRLVEHGVKYLFPNVEGNMLHPDSISKKMYKICEASGVKPRACHEYRRTFATKSYNTLEDTEKTRKLMMISDTRVLKRYINEDMDMLKESAEKLNFVTQILAPRPLVSSMR